MRRIFALLLSAYALSLCFGDAFKLHTWVPVPMAVLLLALVIATWSLLLRPGIRLDRGWFQLSDLLLVALIVDLGVSLLVSGRIELTNLDHLLAYTVVVALFYFFVKFLCAADDTYVHYETRVKTAVTCAVLLVSTYAILEFVDSNLTHLGITSFVKFPGEEGAYHPIFLTLIRARGFMAESGTLALFLNAFAPMGFVFLRSNVGPRAPMVFLLIAVCALSVTFSVAGVVFMAMGLLVAVGMYTYDRGVILVPVRAAVMLLCLAVVVASVAAYVPGAVWSVTAGKLTLIDATSGQDRLGRWLEAATTAAQHPAFGTGIGSTSVEEGRGVISFYLTMLKEAGVPALLLSVAFLLGVFRQIWLLPRGDPTKYAYGASFVAVACHYGVISDIWYPWLWFLCVLVTGERRSLALRVRQDLLSGSSEVLGDQGRRNAHQPTDKERYDEPEQPLGL